MGLVWTTDDSEFAPRRSGYTWEVLSVMLGRELGPEYEQLLAEPVPRGEGKTDWYAPLEVKAVPAADLDTMARAALLDRLEGMRRQIRSFAERVEAPGQRGGGNRGLAEELRTVIVVPNEDRYVWSLGGNPLLVAWGRRLYGGPTVKDGSLLGVGTAERIDAEQTAGELTDGKSVIETPSADPIVQPGKQQKERPSFPWALPLWAIFAVLVVACYHLLLHACGIIVAPEDSLLARLLPRACYAEARADPIPLERQRKDELEERIRQAELDVARIEGDCKVPVPSPTPRLREQRADCRPHDQLSERLQREHALLGSLEIALEWDGREDLDLHVTCPGGEIGYGSKTGCGGGQLDTDMNGGLDRMSDHPVEHVVWQTPPLGQYSISVSFYDRRGQPQRSVPFDVYITRNGQREGPFHGTVSQVKQRVDVRSFTVEANPLPVLPSQECENQ